jgi:GT2 family glycosyltransferase
MIKNSSPDIVTTGLIVFSKSDKDEWFKICLKSIVNQIQPLDQLVCVLNSIDASEEVLRLLNGCAPRVDLVRTDKFLRFGPALNLGIRECLGEFIFRFDPDDIYFKRRVKTQLDYLRINPDIDILGSAIVEFSNDSSEKYIHRYPQDKNQIMKELVKNNPIAHPSVVMKLSVLKQLGGYVDLKNFEDYELWVRAIAAGFELRNLPEPLVFYRINISKSKKPNLSLLSSDLVIYRKLRILGYKRRVLLFRIMLRLTYRVLPRYIKNLSRKIIYLKPYIPG